MAQGAKDHTTHVRLEKVARPAACYPHRREEINNVGILLRPQTIIIMTMAIEFRPVVISSVTSAHFRNATEAWSNNLQICAGTKKHPNDRKQASQLLLD